MTMLVLKCSNVFLPSLVSVDDLNHTFHAITYNQANRFPRSHRGRPSSIVSSKSFTRDIILLAPLETCVPRGASRAQLHDEGRVTNIGGLFEWLGRGEDLKEDRGCFSRGAGHEQTLP